MKPLDVLISLHQGYGLGDAVQMSAVLRHVVKYRPHWRFDFQAEPGKQKVGAGMAQTCFCFGEPYPRDHYDAEAQILLYDTFYNFHDRPNTRVSSCLHERFGLEWDAECARYRVDVSPEAAKEVDALLAPLCGKYGRRRNYKGDISLVAIHYEGDSSPTKKNLTHRQALKVCKAIEQMGRTPLLLDWRNRSPLPLEHDILTTGRIHGADKIGGDAEFNCAVIAQCEAFVGIDSGPAKCASATETPALVVWTGHHPAPFHDPAPNTTHLVPIGYHGLEPVCGDLGVIDWFERNYNVRTYDSDYSNDLVTETAKWLEDTLR